MGLGDILEFLIPAFIIYQFIKGFTQNKKKVKEREEVAHPNQPEPAQSSKQPENLNDVFQALFSDEGFTPGGKTHSSHPTSDESDSETAHILGRKVQKPLDEVDLDAPSDRRDAVQFDHTKTRYEDEFARQREFLEATDSPRTAGGHTYFEEETDADLFDSHHGFGALSSTEKAAEREREVAAGKSFVDGLFADPNALQKAVVMKEVLDRPVSMRSKTRG